MGKFGLKNLIEQMDKAMAAVQRGSDEYMALWRVQAKARAELSKLERLNEIHAFGMELALRRGRK
jgi:hypothetical protein